MLIQNINYECIHQWTFINEITFDIGPNFIINLRKKALLDFEQIHYIKNKLILQNITLKYRLSEHLNLKYRYIPLSTPN